MAKIKQFEAFTKILVAYKKNWVYDLSKKVFILGNIHPNWSFSRKRRILAPKKLMNGLRWIKDGEALKMEKFWSLHQKLYSL